MHKVTLSTCGDGVRLEMLSCRLEFMISEKDGIRCSVENIFTQMDRSRCSRVTVTRGSLIGGRYHARALDIDSLEARKEQHTSVKPKLSYNQIVSQLR